MQPKWFTPLSGNAGSTGERCLLVSIPHCLWRLHILGRILAARSPSSEERCRVDLRDISDIYVPDPVMPMVMTECSLVCVQQHLVRRHRPASATVSDGRQSALPR